MVESPLWICVGSALNSYACTQTATLYSPQHALWSPCHMTWFRYKKGKGNMIWLRLHKKCQKSWVGVTFGIEHIYFISYFHKGSETSEPLVQERMIVKWTFLVCLALCPPWQGDERSCPEDEWSFLLLGVESSPT